MSSREPHERRKKPRIQRRLPVRFGTEARMCGGTVVDISEGGLRVESPESFPIHSILNVFVQFPRHAVRLRARITWSGGNSGGSPAMGLAFTQPEPALAKAYKEWLAEVKLAMAEEPAPAPASPAPAAPAAAPPEAAPKAAQPAAVAEPRGPIRRRLESRQGQSYDILMERRAGGWRLTIVQLPRQLGVQSPDHEADYPDHAAAEAALRDFVRAH
ncbi:MAG TPA: PilZ domain-containing protein [Candidatus Polarisedimenticolia bacterium]|nr:PilZ domain-containing protein [Candidatus Polarisedimenticolia bacterium]